MSFIPGEPIEAVREKVVSALSLHFANDRLTMEELEHRLGLVYSARSPSELNQLLADLPASVPAGASQVALAPADEVPRSRTIIAIMGEFRRQGAWMLSRHLHVVGVMGTARIDLRAATFAPGMTTINALGLMSEIMIIVPPGIGVEADGTGIMGCVDSLAELGSSTPGQPTLRIRGLALMSNIRVIIRGIGEK